MIKTNDSFPRWYENMFIYLKEKRSVCAVVQLLNQMSDFMCVRTHTLIIVTVQLFFTEILLLNTIWKPESIGNKSKCLLMFILTKTLTKLCNILKNKKDKISEVTRYKNVMN